MCWLIIIGVPPSALPHLRNYRSTRGGIAISEHSDPVIRTVFPASDYLFDITRGGCSCGIGLPEVRNVSGNQKRLLRRYSEAGWSPTKIVRALENSRRAKGRVNQPALPSEPMHALKNLVRLLVGVAGHIRFFAHDDTKARPVAGERSSVSAAEFDTFQQFPTDVLLDIHR